MKIAIISDLHSNIEALQACLSKASSLNVEQYVCLGDIVGYGPDPAATLDMVMALPNIVVIRGNHEEALFGAYYKGLRQHIQQTIDWTKQQLSESQLNYLQALSYQQNVLGMTMVHATADQPEKWGYLYNTELARKCMQASGTRLTFVGHTHQPQVFYETPDKEIKDLLPQVGVTIPIYQQGRYVVNVGSVGQPRDENNAASFAVYDTDERELLFCRIAYEYAITAKKIVEQGLPAPFAERLEKGH